MVEVERARVTRAVRSIQTGCCLSTEGRRQIRRPHTGADDHTHTHLEEPSVRREARAPLRARVDQRIERVNKMGLALDVGGESHLAETFHCVQAAGCRRGQRRCGQRVDEFQDLCAGRGWSRLGQVPNFPSPLSHSPRPQTPDNEFTRCASSFILSAGCVCCVFREPTTSSTTTKDRLRSSWGGEGSRKFLSGPRPCARASARGSATGVPSCSSNPHRDN